MVVVGVIKMVALFQLIEEGMPRPCKVGTNFTPDALNVCILLWPVDFVAKRIIGWGNTHVPHMKLPQLGPLVIIMKTDTYLFSPQWSPCTWEGSPYFINVSMTVEDLLSVWASSPTTLQGPKRLLSCVRIGESVHILCSNSHPQCHEWLSPNEQACDAHPCAKVHWDGIPGIGAGELQCRAWEHGLEDLHSAVQQKCTFSGCISHACAIIQ